MRINVAFGISGQDVVWGLIAESCLRLRLDASSSAVIRAWVSFSDYAVYAVWAKEGLNHES